MAVWTIIEDSTFTVLARVHVDGAYVLQSDLTSINYQIWYTDSTTAHTTATALTVADVIFDTLQTNAFLWPVDSTGYNFKHTLDHTVLTDPTRRYRLEYNFVTTDSNQHKIRTDPIELTGVKWS